MRVTRSQLRRLILETMISPTDLADRLLADPQVDQNIKDLLSHPDEEEQVAALELAATLYPQYEDEITKASTGVVWRGTQEYKDEFDMATLFGRMRGAGFDDQLQEAFIDFMMYAGSWRTGPSQGYLNPQDYTDLIYNWFAIHTVYDKPEFVLMLSLASDPDAMRYFKQWHALEYGSDPKEVNLMIAASSIAFQDLIDYYDNLIGMLAPRPPSRNTPITNFVEYEWF